MTARIYFTLYILATLALVSGWWWLVDLLTVSEWAKHVIFYGAPGVGAFLYVRRSEKQ